MTLRTTFLAAAITAFAGTSIFAAAPSLAHPKSNKSQIERIADVILARDETRRLSRQRRRTERRRAERRRAERTRLSRPRDFRRGRRLRKVTASAKVRGFGPRFVQKRRARRLAILRWREKVSDRFGFRFSRWFAARGKDVNCFKRRRGVRCIVSARPSPSFRRFGFRGL